MKTVFTIILSISYSFLFAQGVQWSEESGLESEVFSSSAVKRPGYDMIGFNDEEIIRFHDSKLYDGYQYTVDDAYINIQVYDRENLTILETIRFKVKDYQEENEHYYGLTFLGGLPHVIMLGKNEEKKYTEVYLKEMNFSAPYIGKRTLTLGRVDNFKLIDDDAKLPIFNAESGNRMTEGFYTCYTSRENKLPLHDFRIYNEENDIWQNYEYQLPEEKKFTPTYFCIADNGSFAVAGITDLNDVIVGRLGMHIIYKFEEKELTDLELNFEGRYIKSISLIPLNNDQLLIFGHYAEKYGQDPIGWFSQVVSADNAGKGTFNEYGEDFITELWNPGARKFELANTASTAHYDWVGYPDVHECSDGSKFVVFNVGHEKSLEDLNYSGKKTPRNFKNLIVARLDVSGSLLWKKNIYINSVTPRGMMIQYIDQGFNSYCLNDKLYLFINENFKSSAKEIYKTRMFSVDQNGETAEIWSDKQTAKGLVIHPSYSFHIEGNQFMVYASNKSSQRIGLLNIPD